MKRHRELSQNGDGQEKGRQLPNSSAKTPEELLQELLEQDRKPGATGKKIPRLHPGNLSPETTEKLIRKLLEHQPQLAKDPNKAKSTQKQAK